jgi:hypothetical protein
VAEDATWEGVGGKTEMFKALQQGRDDSWLSQSLTLGHVARSRQSPQRSST